MNMQLVGKLTAKSLGWDRNAIGSATADTTVPRKLATIVGIVSGLRQTINQETGDVQSGLKGNFRGISTLNEKVIVKNDDGSDKTVDGKPVYEDTGNPISITSGVCYLPGGIQDMIEGALAKAKEGDPKATVSFGIDLYALKDTNKAGYTFRAETKVDTSQRDPLDILMDQAKGAPALTDQTANVGAADAPASTEEKAEETAVSEGAKADDPKATGKAKGA
jgi:hypothetical protein